MKVRKKEVYDILGLTNLEREMLHEVVCRATIDDLTNNLDVDYAVADTFLSELFEITKEV